jgi:hypothetical protein
VLDCIDIKIISILEKAPFESAHSIAQVLNVDHITGLYCLHENLGFKSYCLRCVPHLLTGKLRAKRKELTGLMIPYLETASKNGWRHPATGDESWFFLPSGPYQMWALAKDEVATETRTDIQSTTFMVIIMWNPHGFHVIDWLPSGAKINSTYSRLSEQNNISEK